MRRLWIASLTAAGLLLTGGLNLANTEQEDSGSKIAKAAAVTPKLGASRQGPLDLEVGGDLAGFPHGTTRYITREDLLALPQEVFTVTDDPNFTGPTQIAGVPLAEFIRSFGTAPESDMVVAICDDQYRAYYPRAYVAAHDPLLVLTINGQPPPRWPKSTEGQGSDMGPYLISHPKFSPAFKVFSYADAPQIPWGVMRIELREENAVFRAIAPRGTQAHAPIVEAGYRIAQQNCFHCHNMGREGGQKSGTPWLVLSAWAATSPKHFADYVRNPLPVNPHAQMPGNPAYDDETIAALAAYFRTFVPDGAGSAGVPAKKGNR